MKTEYSEVDGNVAGNRLYFLVGRSMENIGAQFLQESQIVG